MLRVSSTVLKHLVQQAKQIKRLKSRSVAEISSLSPEFARHIQYILAYLEQKGWVPIVYHGERTKEEQAKIVKAGHSKTMNSFHVAETALGRNRNGLYWEVRGQAADIVDARYLWAGPASDLEFQFWKDLGAVAKALGLGWGGDWKKFKDVAHVEMTDPHFIDDIRNPRVSRTA